MIAKGISPAQLTHSDGGLRSCLYDDIYYQPQDGLAETEHVFLDGNDLPARFSALPPHTHFTIAELGFGTGLNAIAAMTAFLQFAPSTAHLHYWSVDAHPIAHDEFTIIVRDLAKQWPKLAEQADHLATHYPKPRPGVSQICFSERITLTLGFGDALTLLEDTEFFADAWFLDGFSPDKNPKMWSQDLMNAVYDHTQDSGTAATFTVAGHVRRALISAGFEAKKTTGFGPKRHMLRLQKPGRVRRTSPPRVAIIGAGIAGAASAWHLNRAGCDVTVYDAIGPASGASGNPLGLVMPRFEVQDTPSARFYRDAFLYAHRFYSQICPGVFCALGGVISPPDAEIAARYRRVTESPIWHSDDLQLSPENSIFVAEGAALQPALAVTACMDGVSFVKSTVDELSQQDNHVCVQTEHSEQIFDYVVIAAAGGYATLLPAYKRDLIGSRGQVDIFKATAPKHIVTSRSYIAPLGKTLVAGATYDPVQFCEAVTPSNQSTEENRLGAAALLGAPIDGYLSSRASIRAMTNDQQPICGALDGDDKIFVLTGLGSRGLCTGPYLAAHICAKILSVPSALPRSAEPILATARFTQRRKKRGQEN